MLWKVSTCAILLFPGRATAQLVIEANGYPSPWGSGGGDWEDAYGKARDFVSKLTLTEKVNLTTGTGWEADRCVGNTGSVPRLGFRGFCLEDGPLGVRYIEGNSAFPAGVNAAATWSRDLIRKRGVAMGEEFRGKGIDVQLGPAAGPLGRVPEGGRNWEGFSPDPYLTGVGIAETVRGIQGAGVIACAKHYILNEQEHYRTSLSSNVDDKTMHELYLWPFADAVRAGVGSIMCSYNRINGTYSCQNEWTTNYLLKNELNFQGFVVSDWGAQHSGIGDALAGLDMAMPGDGAYGSAYNSFWGGALTEAVLEGTIPQWRLDDMAMRIMAAYFMVHPDENVPTPIDINFSAWTKETEGYLHPNSNTTWTTLNERVNVQGNHAEIIREVAAKSVVLLKNLNNTLPLAKPASIAVIGEDAQDIPEGPNFCVDRGCNRGTLAMAWGSATAEFPYLVSPATALRRQAAADGTRLASIESNWDLEAAASAASSAAVAVVFANADAGENFITVGGNAGDRNNLTLWNGGDALVRAVAAANANTVVVLHTVGPVLVEHLRVHPNVTALLWAGLPGQESGSALVDVLYGAVGPQGRSPFTWGKERGDWGVDVLYESAERPPQQDFDEGVFVDYRYFDREGIEPSFAFGFGLSYTTFEYADLSIVKHAASDYEPASGSTEAAPTFGAIDMDPHAAMAPEGFTRIPLYVYPWLSGRGLTNSSTGVTVPVGSRNGSAQPLLPAGGAPGGNPGLYEVLYTVSALVRNTGKVAGTEIPQLYLSFGDPSEPKVVLRGFDDIYLESGEEKVVSFNLTYRDIGNWDVGIQNWEDRGFTKTVYVGASSRDLRLNGTLS